MNAVSRQPGRPPICPTLTAIRVIDLHKQRLSLAAIAATLTREGLMTPAGRPVWHKSQVDRLLHTRHVQIIRGKLQRG